MVQWTKQQQSAIDSRGTNILLSAAAGSGKTAVLVERIKKLIIDDKVEIDEMLIVTFTNAAAGEMRERILDALLGLMETNNTEFLRRQISKIHSANITTIHSFCLEVVRNHFHVINRDPSFKIGDVTEINILKKEALEETLELFYEKEDKDFVALVETFSSNRSDESLKELIIRIYDFSQSNPEPLKWLKSSIETYNVKETTMTDIPWFKTFKEYLIEQIEFSEDMLYQGIKLCELANGPSAYIDTLHRDLENIAILKDAFKMDYEDIKKAIESIKHPRLGRIKKEDKDLIDDEIKGQVKHLRDYYKNKVIKTIANLVKDFSEKDHVNNLNKMFPTMNGLYNVIKTFDQIFKNMKSDNDLVDFNDLEHDAIKILNDKEISDIYREKFKYIFLDEYQDSNIVQEKIINLIKRTNNLFLVGDVKQSIYKFRLADPSLFIDKYESYSKNSPLNKRIDLNKNFRSRVSVLDGINFIFKNLMSKKFGELSYTEDAYLYKGLEFDPIEDETIEVNIIDSNDDDSDIDETIQELNKVELEAEFIVSKIKELVFNKGYDYKDIVILLRSTKNWAQVFEQTLYKADIPIYSDVSSGYFDSVEVKVFLNLLKIIINKKQDIPLVSVMNSTIGGFTVEEISLIKGKTDTKYYYDALIEYRSLHNDALSNKIKSFLSDLDVWSKQSMYTPLDELIWLLLMETNYYHYIGAMPGGKIRQSNLRLLVDRAANFKKSNTTGLFNFINFIEKMKQSSGDLSTAKVINEMDNVVRLMSIHKSKGLEFPIVILGGAGKQFNLMDIRSKVLIHKDFGLGTDYIDYKNRTYTSSLSKFIMKEIIKNEVLAEEMRILYVAMTRAIDRLIIFGSTTKYQKKKEKWSLGSDVHTLKNAKSYLDWIMFILQSKLDDTNKLFTDNSCFKVSLLERSDLNNSQSLDSKKEDYKELLDSRKNKNDLREYFTINDKFRWKYPVEKSTIPLKVSVTEMKNILSSDREVNKLPRLIKQPEFMAKESKISGAEIGTAVHKILSLIDFSKDYSLKKLEDDIDTYVAQNLITQRVRRKIDPQYILNFLDSELGHRLKQSSAVYKEKPFVLKKEYETDVFVQGIIDCYFEEEDEIVLIDYKTDYLYEEIVGKYTRQHTPQLQLYKEALEKITQKKVKESYIYFLQINKAVKVF